ncbi:MAG: YicC family protein [Bacteroidetes bacterium]|nr:YicC family protein [Bacteroidota bacterium]
MVYSMTGFGSASGPVGNRKLQVEIRSLNSKGLDAQLKLPQEFREYEGEIRQLAARILERGKVDLWLQWDDQSQTQPAFNEERLMMYISRFQRLSARIGLPDSDWLGLALRMPDVLANAPTSLSDEEWTQAQAYIEKAMLHTQEHRRAEGEAMAQNLKQNLDLILERLEQLQPLDTGRKQRIRERLLKALDEAKLNNESGENRLEQELIFYLEKWDISEEKVRLSTHCAYFLETMHSPEAAGRKLNFIAQEMGREINTIGSKSNEAAMQRCVVEMKDELEKIKELALNIL